MRRYDDPATCRRTTNLRGEQLMILRCTAKLLKLLGASPASPPDVDPETEWYANLLWFARRKCLLVTHAPTLFSVFVPDVRKPQLTPIGPFVLDAIRYSLMLEDLPPETFGRLDGDDVQVAKTASRSVLGSMNEMAFQIEHALDRSDWDFDEINRWLRRTIFGSIAYRQPLDLAAEAPCGCVGYRLRTNDPARRARARHSTRSGRGPSLPASAGVTVQHDG
jgi:hypothetical protein